MSVSKEIIEKFMNAYSAPAVTTDEDIDDPTISEEQRQKSKLKREKLQRLMREKEEILAKEAEQERLKQQEEAKWINSEWEKLEQDRQKVTKLRREGSLTHLALEPQHTPTPVAQPVDQTPVPEKNPLPDLKKPAKGPLAMFGSKALMNKAATVANLGTFGLPKAPDTRQMKDVPKPLTTLLQEALLFSMDGMPNLELLKNHLHKEGRLDISAVRRIIKQAQNLFRVEPNVLELRAPFTVIGDIHGQYHDLEKLIEKGGDPKHTKYLFLGDYVDRGMFATEVCFYLFAMKILYPNNIFLLRGNHESRVLTEYFNFKIECNYKYSEEVYDLFMETFDCLPLSALITNALGTFFCAHGGIGPELDSIQQIRDLDRFVEIPEEGNYCDLIWSDPIELDEDLDEYEIIQWSRVEFQFNSARGCGWSYGYASVDRFLEENNLICIVRAHEVQKDGFFEHTFGLEERDVPPVITVFSAPNYCDVYENYAGLMRISEHDYDFDQIDWVEHPYYLPNFVDVITFSLPFVAENLMKIFAYVLSIPDEDIEDEVDISLQKKITYLSKMSVVLKKARLETEASVNPAKTFNRGQDTFKQALNWDKSHEKRPKTSPQRKLQKFRSCRF